MTDGGCLPNAPDAREDSPILSRALAAAVVAYDVERCRQNDLHHGGRCQPMSDANRQTIRPMIAAAVEAYLDVVCGLNA